MSSVTEVRDTLLDIVTVSDYNKGLKFPKGNIVYNGYELLENGEVRFNFDVESENRFWMQYMVDVKIHGKQIYTFCSCPQFRNFGSCKHLAGCLYHYYDSVFKFSLEDAIKSRSLSIINSLVNADVGNNIVKEEIGLDVEFRFTYIDAVEVSLKIGKDRKYVIKNKLGDLFRAYREKDSLVYFGKNFTYDPNKYFFNEIDKSIIDFLYEYYSERMNAYYISSRDIVFSNGRLKSFLKLFVNKKFNVSGYGEFNGIKNDIPFSPVISKNNNGEYIFDLNINSDRFHQLSLDYEYIVLDGECYHVSSKYANLLDKMFSNNINSLIFEKKDLGVFTKNIIPIVKEDVLLDENVNDDIVIVKRPNSKLYFDLYKDMIICNLKLVYGDKEIEYFDNVNSIYRDSEYENNIINDLISYKFNISNKSIYMEDLYDIGEFLDEKLELLCDKYDVYTSSKIKDTKVIKNSNVSSTFSIGKDNIMNYSFDLGDISNNELDSILDSLRNKKKYYRLKSGDFINLEQDNNLKQLENLVSDLDISSNDLKKGKGEIPKYRAIYLDSLKKSKYNIIKTNNLFDNFVNNFNLFKKVNYKFDKVGNEILRDYQKDGVKWLYTLYKCDFGGILADEMGLGKSIQIIYFFKKLLSEDKDSKFLIIVPTSLVYNWENEFNKFAPNIKYEIFHGNRANRRERLETSKSSVYITSYGLIREDIEIYKNMNFKVCVIDEAQNIKNPDIGITKCVKSIKANTRIALTGTPLENSVMELWSIFDFIMPGFLSNQNKFKSKYKVKDFDDDTNKLLDRLNKQISPFILRRKKMDVLSDLPDKIENNIYIDLDPDQKKIYALEVKRVREEIDELVSSAGFMKSKFMILKLLTRLRQICIDPRLVYENYNLGSSKMDNLINVILELISNGHKILLFSSFKTALELVIDEFNKNDISYYFINGSVSSKKRMEMVDNFNNDSTNVFLITLKSGGTGLNLTSADTVIHLDLWWNPQVENQATDRAHRIGQKNVVSVVKLITRGTIEERILELQDKKKILSDKLIEGDNRGDNVLSELSENDIKNLLSYEQE